MSLINQMLKDIEARRKTSGQGSPGDALSSVPAAPGPERRKRPITLAAGLGLGVLLAGGLIWSGVAPPRSPATAAPTEVVAVAAVVTPVSVVAETSQPLGDGSPPAPSPPESVPAGLAEPATVAPSVAGEIPEPPPPAAAVVAGSKAKADSVPAAAVAISPPKQSAPAARLPAAVATAELKKVRLSGRFDQPRLVADFDRRPEAGVAIRSEANSLVFSLPLTRYIDTLPQVPAGGVISGIEVRYVSGATELLLRLAVPCTAHTSWRPSRSGGAQLLVDLYPQAPFPVQSAVSTAPATEAVPAAKPLAETSVDAAPAAGQADENIPLRMEEARRLVEQGDFAEARSLLLRTPRPALVENPEYYALLAATQQRLGHYGEAVDSYRQILQRFPENGTWWMGLGIALESDGRRTEAGDAYRQALAIPGLLPELAQYVRQRLAALNPR